MQAAEEDEQYGLSRNAPPSAAPLRPGVMLGLLALLVAMLEVAPSADAGFREDELQCEEAAARLMECCPEFRPESISCDYVKSMGCGSDQYPALDSAAYDYLTSHSCEEIEADGWCTFPQGAPEMGVP